MFKLNDGISSWAGATLYSSLPLTSNRPLLSDMIWTDRSQYSFVGERYFVSDVLTYNAVISARDKPDSGSMHLVS